MSVHRHMKFLVPSPGRAKKIMLECPGKQDLH